MTIKMFVSHSSKDEEFIKEIELLLARKFRDKIKPVISSQRKDINVELGKKISSNIKECQWFMVLLTRNSISNPTVIHELGYASALHDGGRISTIIPVVERLSSKQGKMIQIDTGVFIHPSIESAKYIAEEESWGECILDISEYLQEALKTELKPRTDILEERALALVASGLQWEAAEALREAGKRHSNFGNLDKAIIDFSKAADLYEDADYIWESGQLHLNMARLLGKTGDMESAADEYKKRAEILIKTPDYNWEAANSWEKAGDLYQKKSNLKETQDCYLQAIEIFKEGENEIEMDRVKKRLKKLEKKI